MPMIMIFAKCGTHVRNMHLVTFIDMRDFYSREICQRWRLQLSKMEASNMEASNCQ